MSISLGQQLAFADFSQGYAIAIFSIWGLGVDIPRLLVRYGKAYPMVINMHSMLMLLLGLLTIMYVGGEIVVYQNNYGPGYAGLSGAALAQFATSIVLACLVLIQFVLGFLVRVEMFSSRLSSALFTVKRVHRIGGWVVTLFGKVVATLVVYSNCSEVVFKAWLFCLGGLAILMLVCEVVYRSQSRTIILSSLFKHKNRHHRYHNEIYQALLEHREKFNAYQTRGVRYVIVDNSMYYIDEDFMHPGGERIFTLLNGQEVNYYLKGAKAIAPDLPRHTHTKFVAKYLENRLVGELNVQPLLANLKLANDQVDWRITSCLRTNYVGAYLVQFENDSGDARESLRVQNFGKYAMLGCSSQELLARTERPYFFCYSAGEYQKALLDKYRKYYKYYYYGEQIEEGEEKRLQVDALTRKLTFVIKEYKRGLFTRYLLNAPKERLFNISGPYGRGLGLRERSAGYYMLVAGGMGVMAFIDLFTFLLQRTLHALIKAKASSVSLRQINGESINFDPLCDLKILLVGTFTSSDKFYLSTAVKELYYLNKKHGLTNFNMMLHYQNTEIQRDVKMIKENLDSEFFRTIVEEEQPDRIIYSGPGALQQILRRVEPELKLKHEIHYL